MTPRSLLLPAVVLGLLGLGLTAYLMIMTTFMIYDDEGFVLLTLRNFLAGSALYDDVFSQYGPTPYLYHWLLTLGGTLDLTHMFGRLVTLGHWVTAAAGVGWISAQLVERHRFATGSFAALFSFNLLWQMVAEPSHPGSMIAAILAMAAVLSVKALREQRPGQLAAVLGLTGALLVFTKINVGAFFIAGVGAFALAFTAWPRRWAKLTEGLALIGISLLPWLLMAGNLSDPAMRGFALKASLAGAALWWILPRLDATERVAPPVWARTLGWFIGGSGMIVGFMLLRGTSFSELIAAVFIDPLQQPGHFTVPPRNSPASVVFAAISFALVGWAGWIQRTSGKLGPGLDHITTATRLVVVVGMVWFATRWPSPWGVFTCLDYVLPLLPLWLVRGDRGTARQTTAEALIAFIAVTQVLHAYPVAGSQIGWGCFLSIVLLAPAVQRDLATWHARVPRWVALGAAATVWAAAGWGTATLAKTGWQRYQGSEPLPFVGAGDIRLDDRTRITLTAMVQNSIVHADMLFTRQGMYSFNLWSQVPPPTSRNATHWFWLLDEAEQQAVIGRLANETRSAFIVNLPLDDFLAHIDVEVAGPLQDFLESHYTSALTLNGFDFRIPAVRKIAPLGVGWLWREREAASAGDASKPVTLMFSALIQGIPASIEIITFDAMGNAQPADVPLTDGVFAPVRRDGTLMGEFQPLPAASRIEGIFRFQATLDQSWPDRDRFHHGMVIKDARGVILAEALLN